jgi:hypothetical protein
MPTISELVDKHSKVPGDIRVHDPECEDDWQPYRPFMKDRQEDWHCLDVDGSHQEMNAESDCWQLYTEPKPKVMRAQYLVYRCGDERPFTTNHWYYDDADLKDDYDSSGLQSYQRLQEREFER